LAFELQASVMRFLNYRLDRKISALRNAHDEKIEALRADLAHVQDRGRRANELEFEAVTQVWHSFVDAWLKTQQAIVEYMEFPDLNNLSESDLATFMESTELSNPQRQQVMSAKDKNDMYFQDPTPQNNQQCGCRDLQWAPNTSDRWNLYSRPDGQKLQGCLRQAI
jgi:hypothetical protein